MYAEGPPRRKAILMSNVCEDAPCCGCCGTGVYGRNDGYGYSEPDYDFYDREDADPDDLLDPSECSHGNGDYSLAERLGMDADGCALANSFHCYDCDTEGTVIYIMGAEKIIFPVTESDTYEGGEDRHLDGSYEA
jgi:hypothetical protein